MSNKRIESQLWDFKETLEMWHVRGSPEKGKVNVRFCEHVAGFANAKGGVLIIGITDKLPRKVVGVPDLENRSHYTKKTLENHVRHSLSVIHFQPIPVMDESEKERICLIIAIAQTKDIIPVKDERGKFSYPVRLETGLHRISYNELKESKAGVMRDNLNFISSLNSFSRDK